MKATSRDIIGLSRMRGCFSSTNTRHSLASACPRPTYGDSGWRVFGADMNITEAIKQRFWDKVDVSGRCWEWTAHKSDRGYGDFKANGKTVRAHRFAYSLVVGPIPEGMLICHHCDNPGCVKPSHLFMGTQGDNQKDSVNKGRKAHGVTHGRSKVVENDVHEIRRLYATGSFTLILLGKMWRIDHSQISNIIHRRHWRHI